MNANITTRRAAARITVDGWTVDVEHADRIGVGTFTRNLWRWTVTEPWTGDPFPDEITGEMPPIPGRRTFTGVGLESITDLFDPDPIAALCSLGFFLGAYAEAWQYGTEQSDNRALFPATLDPDVAGTIADAIALEWPED